jgi:hypothetical membrane protein
MLRIAERHHRTFGSLGPAIIAVGTLISLWRYQLGGGDTRPFYYWPVSGLGDHNVAPWPVVFNVSIITGALCMALFLIGVGRSVGGRVTWAGVSIGVIAALGLVGVGFFPSAPETLDIHYTAAGIAFIAAALFATGFVLHLVLHHPPHFPKWLALPSTLSILCTTGLIFSIATFVTGHKVQVLELNLFGIQISAIILLEWSAFISLQLWIMLTAIAMRPMRPEKA